MSFWRNYQLYVYVALMALLSWWLQQLYEQRQAEIKVAENSPDFFSAGYYKKEMDLQGLPKSELIADKMQHFKADGSIHLEQPKMTLFNPDAAPWLDTWETVAERADWNSLLDVRKSFRSADAVSVRSGEAVTVFNACGNKYRMVVAIKYKWKIWRIVYVLQFMTHAEYGRSGWKALL